MNFWCGALCGVLTSRNVGEGGLRPPLDLHLGGPGPLRCWISRVIPRNVGPCPYLLH